MPMSRTYRFISILWISLLGHPVAAQQPQATPQVTVETTNDTVKVSLQSLPPEKAPLLAGAAVSVDICGLAMKGVGAKFANMEAAARINFKEKYFPLFEIGLGDCTREGQENNNLFSTTAPYFRIGMDYNFNKKLNGNRFFGGLRYGFSAFKYDFSNPDFTDEVWQQPIPFNIKDHKARAQWAEVVIGVETKLWSIVRLGYNVRYRLRLSQSGNEWGDPWYVPGFGRNGGTTWGGTVNLTFDVGKSARNPRKESRK